MRTKLFYALLTLALLEFQSALAAQSGRGNSADAPDTGERIHRAAERFLKDFTQEQDQQGRKTQWQLGSVDRRLSLSPCPEPLQVEFTGDPERSVKNTLLVSCKGDQPWRLFLSAELEITREGWVTGQPIGRGQRLKRDMLEKSWVMVNKRRRSSFSDPQLMLGMEARRSINAGTAITPDMLVRPEAVERGDQVVISVSNDAFSINTRGQAVNSGRIGEQIYVINKNSGRRIRARIAEPGRVQVIQ